MKRWPVATGLLKSELYGWLNLDKPTVESGDPYPAGFCHFPELPEEYFKQLTAEQLVTRIEKGYRKPRWEKTRERNEALDCRIYSRAAAAQYGLDRFTERHWASLEKQIGLLLKQQQEKLESGASAPTTVPVRSRTAPTRRVIRSSFLDR